MPKVTITRSFPLWGNVCPAHARRATFVLLFFPLRLNKFDEYNVSSQATAWVKK